MTSLQPIGIAIAQVLAYYAANQEEVTFADAAPAIRVVIGATVLVWAIVWKPLGSARRAALLTSFIALGFWGISRLVLEGDARSWTSSVAAGTIIALLFVAGAMGLAVWLKRTSRNLTPAYRAVDAASLIGVAIPLVALGTGFTTDVTTQPEARHATPPLVVSGAQQRPDIYIIVLDAYGRDDELEEHFGIERGLGERLEGLGFYVASQSRANYSSTLYALPSLLNYDLVQNLVPDDQRTPRRLTRLLRENRFVHELKEMGYHFVSYETGIRLSEFKQADEYKRAAPSFELLGFAFRPSYFERGLMEQTLLGPLLRRSRSMSPYTKHRNRVLNALEDLPRHASDPRPTLALAHVLSPHEPFVFGRHGEDVSPTSIRYDLRTIYTDPGLPEEPGRVGPEYARRYADQATHLADLVVSSVEQILSRSPDPPIIIIQGDHGPYGFSPNVRRTRLAILNAYYLPGEGAKRLYPEISPINSLRVVLNEYFGRGLPLLEDRSFYADWQPNGELIEVR
jgi:hypothetical protein